MIPFARMIQYGNNIPRAARIQTVKTLQYNVFILLDDGRLYGRGRNQNYQLGTGVNTPTIVEEWTLCLENVKEFWCTGSVSGILAVKYDGTWWSTGQQTYRGVTTIHQTWTDVTSIFSTVTNTYQKIVIGSGVTLLLTNTGELYKMGYNVNGEVFTGNATTRVTTLTLTPEVNVVDIGASMDTSSFVLYADGTLKGSGNNGSWTSGSTLVTTLTTITTGVLKINSENSYNAVYVLKSDGIYVAGSQFFGQLGDGVNGNASTSRSIYKIPVATNPGEVDYIGSSNYVVHMRSTSGVWYFAGRDGRQSGNGITSSSAITTYTALPNIGMNSTEMSHTYLITFVVIDGVLYGSGNGSTTSGLGVIPYVEAGAGSTGLFKMINTPS